MKKLLIALSFAVCVCHLYAQDQNTETEIRRLEQVEVKAVLEKDTATLAQLWDQGFVVNSPANMIVLPGKTTVDRPVMTMGRTSFTREIEQIIIRGNTVFSMGSETVVPAGDQPGAGQTVKRRYTNIWMKQEGVWKLVARHANVICQ